MPHIWHRVIGSQARPLFQASSLSDPTTKPISFAQLPLPAMTGQRSVPRTSRPVATTLIKLKLQGGSSQTVTLAAGAGRTFAAIAAEVNAALTGMKLEVDAAGNLNIVVLEHWQERGSGDGDQ